VDGLELCRRIRAERRQQYTYFLLQTTRSGKQSYLTAMRAGIDDFVTKPVDPDELLARLGAAERILDLRRELSQLQGLLPICSYCKRIRRDDQEWQQIERYIAARSDAEFSHGICPDCYRRHVEPQLG
jgi:DNA-binding response OmpR family regulator